MTKKLDISFLPAAIQSALTRGEGLEDSDDSDDDRAAAARSKAAAVAAYGSSSSSKSKASMFLAALPKPKEDVSMAENADSTPVSTSRHVALSPRQSEEYCADEKDAKTSERQSSKYGTEEVNTDGAPSLLPEAPLDASKSGAPPEPAATTLPIYSSGCYSSGYISTPRIVSAPIVSAPVVAAPKVSAATAPVFTAASPSSYALHSTPLEPSRPGTVTDIGPCVYPDIAQYPVMSYSVSSSSAFHSPPSVSFPNAEADAKPSRKRERELQQALYSGDVSVIDNNVNIVNVSAATTHHWDSMKYMDQQKREAEVNKMYGLTGSVAIPTKVQNRKHQINSLAVQAASAELDLLEARTQRSKTKSQTQAKYGW
jgi:hypothetical protein